jgi:uncharacterized phage protein (TIGR01671 family)
MSRIIKFRVWDEQRRQYLKKQYIGEEVYVGEGGIYDTEVMRGTLEQFTGLLDANGKDIFEGDIVFGYAARFSTSLISDPDDDLNLPVYEVDHDKPLPTPDIPLFKATVKWNEAFAGLWLYYLEKQKDWGSANSTILVDKEYIYEVVGNINES